MQLKDYAYRLLRYRNRSEQELRKRLLMKGGSASAIEKIISEFKDMGLINDTEFAADFVRAKMYNHWSQKRLIYELVYKFGISKQTAEHAVESTYDEDFVRKYYIEKFKGQNSRKVQEHLLRKGFNRDFIESVQKAIMQ